MGPLLGQSPPLPNLNTLAKLILFIVRILNPLSPPPPLALIHFLPNNTKYKAKAISAELFELNLKVQ